MLNPGAEEALSANDKTGKQVLDLLGLTPSQLNGRILDLGSGKSEKLKDTPGLPDDCSIVALSKSIFQGFDPYINTLKKKPVWDRKTVEADALDLPYANETFDRILSVDAIPCFLTSTDEIDKAFMEIWRCLKTGGEARLQVSGANYCDMAEKVLKQFGAIIETQTMEPSLENKYPFFKDSLRLIIKKPPVNMINNPAG